MGDPVEGLDQVQQHDKVGHPLGECCMFSARRLLPASDVSPLPGPSIKIRPVMFTLPCTRYLQGRVPMTQDSQPSLMSFMLLELGWLDDPSFVALHVYAVYGVVNHVRAGQLPIGSFDQDQLLWARWREAMSQKHQIYHKINAAWQLVKVQQ